MIDSPTATGVLFSGGLDSAILVGHLLESGRVVQPLYVRSQLIWEGAELAAAERFATALAGKPRGSGLLPLVVLELPLADLYAGHWSITGRGVPDDGSPDEAMFLPGRNALLLVKTVLYCQTRGIGRLALGSLRTNPFADATDQFFRDLMSALNSGAAGPVELELPLAALDKASALALGQRLPLQLTFSCVDPREGRHCGRCNKCAERRAAFSRLPVNDPTDYAAAPSPARRP